DWEAYPDSRTWGLVEAWGPELGCKAVFVDSRYIFPDTRYDRNGRLFQPQVLYFVVGATKMYGAALYRLREEDFVEPHEYGGIAPAWAISYNDIEPDYAKAEQMYQVHGVHGVDATEPGTSSLYPYPSVSNEPDPATLWLLQSRRLHPSPAPCGIISN